MSFAEKALRFGGLKAKDILLCCQKIPYVGKPLGFIIGSLFFIAVEALAFSGYSCYLLGNFTFSGLGRIKEAIKPDLTSQYIIHNVTVEKLIMLQEKVYTKQPLPRNLNNAEKEAVNFYSESLLTLQQNALNQNLPDKLTPVEEQAIKSFLTPFFK